MNRSRRVFGGILLVAGTTIGAGMLALPIVTGFAGFWPAMTLFFLYWLYMTCTAFLILEVNLWMKEQTNLMTMARETLGRSGQIISWILYLFLLYTLTTAYLAGGSPIFLEGLEFFTGKSMPEWIGPLPLFIVFGFFVYQGARCVDYVNRFLMLGLVVSYGLMIFFLTPHVHTSFLTHTHWTALWASTSIIATSFGFHIIIPTLCDYLQRDVKQLRQVIWIGSLIPLLVYISWEYLALGIIPPSGPNGLQEGYEKGLDAATLLANALNHPHLALLARLFSLFAIITSFLGVSLSLRDCLADSLKIKKTRRGRFFLYLMTFVPPLLLTLVDPRAFLNALDYAGAFGVITLLGLYPVLMVWRGRYSQKRVGPFEVPGKKGLLAVVFFISLLIIGLEIANKAGYLPTLSFN